MEKNIGIGLKCPAFLNILVYFFFIGALFGQERLEGRVVDKNGSPLRDAKLRLVTADLETQSNDQGEFSFNTSGLSSIYHNPVSRGTSLLNGKLTFYVEKPGQELKVDLFDKKGQRVGGFLRYNLTTGSHTFNVLAPNAPSAFYVVKIRTPNTETVYHLLNNKGAGLQIADAITTGPLGAFSKSAAAVDRLEVTKEGYHTISVDVLSYAAVLQDIELERNPENDQGLPPITNGQNATTTRYWDCCKPHCAGLTNMRTCDIADNTLNSNEGSSGCGGGSVFQCWDYAPIEINSKVSYGWAAFNNGGHNCGDCFQLDFKGQLQGKQMIVQLINIGDGGQNAFDLLIPGGGVGANNGCSTQWGNNVDLGVTYGGFHGTCGWDTATKECIIRMCEDAFGDKAELMRGCHWYTDWFEIASNPDVTYQKVSCPQEIKDRSRIGN